MKLKPGIMVERTIGSYSYGGDYPVMNVGDRDIVAEMLPHSVRLKKFGPGHSAVSLEAIHTTWKERYE